MRWHQVAVGGGSGPTRGRPNYDKLLPNGIKADKVCPICSDPKKSAL